MSGLIIIIIIINNYLIIINNEKYDAGKVMVSVISPRLHGDSIHGITKALIEKASETFKPKLISIGINYTG